MNSTAPDLPVGAAFHADEPVLTSRSLLPGAVSPLFGQCDQWDLNGVLRRPANVHPAEWKLKFDAFPGPWHLRARELAMIALSPRHPKVMAAGIFAPRRPVDPRTAIRRLGPLRALASWAAERGLPEDLGAWPEHQLHVRIAGLRERGLAVTSAVIHITVIRELHRCGPLLTGGGLLRDPWPGMSAAAAAGVAASGSRALSTPVIPPEVWFPLVRAAWTYVDTFAPDILRAQERWRLLQVEATRSSAGAADRLRAWLADPGNRVPLHDGHHPPRITDAGEVHWNLLSSLIGIDRRAHIFNPARGLREIALEAVERGQCASASLLPEYAQVTRADGTMGGWSRGLAPRSLRREIEILRVACYIFVTALSMMRDSEVQEILKGSVVEYFGAPAVVSAEVKGEEDFPRKHWWIIEPVARALTLAEEITPHPERLFTGVAKKIGNAERFAAAGGIKAFIEHVNARTDVNGLEPIPSERIAPHMFRRTMSMLTDQFPGSEIALGIQLKHVASRALANRTTQGYAASAASWAKHLDAAIEAARFRGLRDLFDAHKANEPIGFGPGAEQLTRTFNTIRDTVAAQGGDATVEHALLKQARISIRFGTLNNCLFDAANPAGAVCLENTLIPPGHTGPLPDRCRPGRCGNSMIGPQHVEIWDSEERSLTKLLETRRLAPGHRAALEQQRKEAQAVLRKAGR
ncbi:integrase [Streptomyces sp. NPDC014603]|uniref:integrase n=1 Tax=Streptomyces sp. NPDC014603 TaxID=3364873 RepID=UPI0036FDCD3D